MQCFYENELFKNKSRRQIKSFSVQQFFKNAAEVWASSPRLRSQWSCIRVVFLGQATGKWKFFDPTIFQKCWRGSGRVALIAARRPRNPCAMLLAHGGGGEKSESFSRRGEQDRSALWNRNRKQVSCNCSGGTVVTKYYFTENPLLLGIPSESGSARLGHIPSLPWESQLPLKPCISLQPLHCKRQLQFFSRFS